MSSEDLQMKSTTAVVRFDLCIASQMIYRCGAFHFGACQPLVTIHFHFMKNIELFEQSAKHLHMCFMEKNKATEVIVFNGEINRKLSANVYNHIYKMHII